MIRHVIAVSCGITHAIPRVLAISCGNEARADDAVQALNLLEKSLDFGARPG